MVTLAVQADTPQHGPVTAAFRLRGASQLLYFYTVLLNLEMPFFSLIAQRGAPSGFSAPADVGEPPTVGMVSTSDALESQRHPTDGHARAAPGRLRSAGGIGA